MAEETVNKCIEVCQLAPTSPCLTTGLLLDGAHDWSPTLFIRLIQDFGVDNAVCFQQKIISDAVQSEQPYSGAFCPDLSVYLCMFVCEIFYLALEGKQLGRF